MHWTRGPSNVPRRTRLTPRNLRDRSLRRPKPPGSRSPDTYKSIILEPKFERPAFKGLLLQRSGLHETFAPKGNASQSPSRVDLSICCRGTRRRAARTSRSNQSRHTRGFNPVDALIGVPVRTCLRYQPRRISPPTAPTDRIVPPEGFPIPRPLRPKAPRPGRRTSRPPEGCP